MTSETDLHAEMNRVHRVADMLSSAHANLCQRFQRRAMFLDLCTLGVSTWLTAVVFVEPKIGVRLTPWDFDPQIWIGMLSISVFFLSVVQLRVDWKGRSDAHRRTFDMYAEVKRECGYLVASEQALTREKCQRVLSRYDMATDVGTIIPEAEFLIQKKKHLQKMAISRFLDDHPFASILVLRLKLWWRDNSRG
jgi:hypothetical protein